LPPQERRGSIERPCRVAAARFVSERGVIDLCGLEIRAQLHARQRHEPDAGIVHVARQELGDFSAKLVRHPTGT
jgi:hypothetical protein